MWVRLSESKKEVSPVDWINDLIKPEKAGAAWKLIAAAFINAPYEHYLAISTAMSRSISVRRGQETRVLQGNEEWAFQGLEGAHAMILDARAFMVNYRPFLPVVMSEIPDLARAFGSNMPSMSMNTSQTSSPSPNSD